MVHEHAIKLSAAKIYDFSDSPCTTTSIGPQKKTMKNCKRNSSSVAYYAKDFPNEHWSFLKLVSDQKWYATLAFKPVCLWDEVAEEMMTLFAESGHLVFKRKSF